MAKTKQIEVQGTVINLSLAKDSDYICITDMANAKDGSGRAADVIKNWFRNRSTVEFLGLWERINNPNFKGVEFDPLFQEAGNNSFTLSPTKWIDTTDAIGIISKTGRGGGTFAHKDIAFEFASWISTEFKLYLIKEFQRLKDDEVVLSNMESINALLIEQNLSQKDRLIQLNKVAIMQMKSLLPNNGLKSLGK